MSHAAGQPDATIEAVWNFFSSSTSEVSAHFGIAKDGRTWQFVDLANTAWANGILEQPDLSLDWLAEAVNNRVNPNRVTISIEHEGDSFETMGELQYQATLALHRALVASNGILPDRQHIIKHSQITGRSRPNCPGPFFPMERLMSDLAKSGAFQDPVTHFIVAEPFASFYNSHGGLAIFGRPITAARPGGTLYLDSTLVQWFERARFELHGQDVMLGLVGSESFTCKVR
jgi:hypothetical protein